MTLPHYELKFSAITWLTGESNTANQNQGVLLTILAENIQCYSTMLFQFLNWKWKTYIANWLPETKMTVLLL